MKMVTYHSAKHYNPKITDEQFCVIAPRGEKDSLTRGFAVIGPFPTERTAAEWARENIMDTEFDNPHWVVDTMTVPTE